jgi:hypothetical protein
MHTGGWQNSKHLKFDIISESNWGKWKMDHEEEKGLLSGQPLLC